MNKLSSTISQMLVDNKIIKNEAYDIYRYGIELFILSVGEIGVILIISALLGNFKNTLCMFLGFLPIRLFSGGYHADTRIGCFAVLVLVYMLFSLVIKYIDISGYTTMLFIIIVGEFISVCIFAPVENIHKKLQPKEKIEYKRRSIILAFICSITAIVGLAIDNKNVCLQAFSIGLVIVLLSILAGQIKNRKECKRWTQLRNS